MVLGDSPELRLIKQVKIPGKWTRVQLQMKLQSVKCEGSIPSFSKRNAYCSWQVVSETDWVQKAKPTDSALKEAISINKFGPSSIGVLCSCRFPLGIGAVHVKHFGFCPGHTALTADVPESILDQTD